MKTCPRHPALNSWGDYDRDDPFPLFAEVRSAAPVHEVHARRRAPGLAGGRPRRGQGGAERPAAVQGHARRAGPQRRGRRRGPARARASPGTCSPSTRPTTPGCGGWRCPRSRRRRVAALEPRIRSIVDDLLADLAARGADEPVDLVAGFAFPLPFTVICELLGIPEPDRADLGRWFADLLAPYAGPQPPAAAVAASDAHRRLPHRAARPQARRAGRGPGDRPRRRRRPRRCAHRAGAALHDLPAGRRRARHDHQPDRQRDRRAAAPPRAARRAGRRPRPRAAGGRGVHALRRAGAALDVPLRDRGDPARRGRHPRRSRRSSCRWRRRTGIPRATATRSRSTSTAPTAGTSPSATASTTVWVRRWPGWRRGSRCRRCTAGSPRCGWPSNPPSCAGGTATDWCCGGCRSSPSCSVLLRRPGT